jgi:RNA polymerase sigma factor (TIGR02999 family)
VEGIAIAPPDAGDVTRILRRWTAGDAAARQELWPLVHAELRRLAAIRMRRERPNDSLRPTELVHEAYLKLVRQDRVVWADRVHFLAVAATEMRRILVDRARRRKVRPAADQITLHPEKLRLESRALEVVALDEVLRDLARLDPRQARIVELLFFGGLSIAETAEAVGVSEATVKRDWTTARAWLRRELLRR